MLERYKQPERTLQSRKTSPELVQRRSLECVLLFLFFFFPFSSLYVTNAEEEEETERKYSLETQRSHRTTSGCQTALSWGRGGSCQQPPSQMWVPGRLDSAPTAGPSVGSTRTAEPGASRPPFSGGR